LFFNAVGEDAQRKGPRRRRGFLLPTAELLSSSLPLSKPSNLATRNLLTLPTLVNPARPEFELRVPTRRFRSFAQEQMASLFLESPWLASKPSLLGGNLLYKNLTRCLRCCIEVDAECLQL
jgi:hypothetical protein